MHIGVAIGDVVYYLMNFPKRYLPSANQLLFAMQSRVESQCRSHWELGHGHANAIVAVFRKDNGL
jgi:hypothetical protein